jgi:hypothetical protein
VEITKISTIKVVQICAVLPLQTIQYQSQNCYRLRRGMKLLALFLQDCPSSPAGIRVRALSDAKWNDKGRKEEDEHQDYAIGLNSDNGFITTRRLFGYSTHSVITAILMSQVPRTFVNALSHRSFGCRFNGWTARDKGCFLITAQCSFTNEKLFEY